MQRMMESGDFSILDTDDLSVPYNNVDIEHLSSQLPNTEEVAKSGKRKFESDSSSSGESDEAESSSVEHCTQEVATLRNEKCDSHHSSSSDESIFSSIEQFSVDNDEDVTNNTNTNHTTCLSNEIDVDYVGNTPLHRLTFNLETNKLLRYLDSCPDSKLHDQINRKNNLGKTALHLAALLPDSKMIEYLLYAGADLGIQDTQGRTILHILAEIGTAETVQALSAISELNGAYVEYSGGPYRLNDIPNYDGLTALHIATLNNDKNMVSFLLSLGAHPGTKDRKGGMTALHFAAEAGNLDLVRVITAGQRMNMEAKTYNGQTALVVAYHRGHNRVVDYLRQIGAVYDPAIIKQFGPVKRKSQRTD